MSKIKLYIFLVMLTVCWDSFAQHTSFSNIDDLEMPDSLDQIIVNKIVLKGNKKTKDFIIQRELSIHKGDTIPTKDLKDMLKLDKSKLLNIDLFITVDLQLELVQEPNQFAITFIFKEAWYLFPVPTFDLADRNFNEWVNIYNADLNRVNYGVLFVKKNVRGRNESLTAQVQGGFTHKYSLSYGIPYIDKNQTYGLGFGVSYAQNKAVLYDSEDNKPLYTEQLDHVALQRFAASAYLSKRDGFYKYHSLSLSYRHHTISDTIIQLNPDYHTTQSNSLRYMSLNYSYSFDNRDMAIYPLRGTYFSFKISKIGLFNGDIDLASLLISYAHHFPISKRLFGEAITTTKVSTLGKRPFNMSRAFGFRYNVRSYQKYMINGQDYFLVNTSLKWQLLKTRKRLGFIPIRQFRTVPINVYLRPYLDAGYANDKYRESTQNQLSNKWLAGAGIGLDIITFYNVTLHASYGINIENDQSFFFNINTNL